jgi:hypothetical protein
VRPVSHLVPATPATGKRGDRLQLLRDANYFAGELLHRLEELASLDAQQGHWHQAAKLVGGVRKLVRHWALEEAQRRRGSSVSKRRSSPHQPDPCSAPS